MRERELQTDKSTKTNESTKSSAKFFSFFDRMHLLWCRNASASPPQSLSRGVAEGAHARKDHTGSPRQPSPEAADAREPSPERADARESLAVMRTQRYLALSLLVLVLVPLPSLLRRATVFWRLNLRVVHDLRGLDHGGLDHSGRSGRAAAGRLRELRKFCCRGG